MTATISDPAALAEGCLALLRREEDFLSALNSGLRRLQTVAARFEPEAQSEALLLQNGLAKAAAAMRQDRQQWRAQAGRQLGVPTDGVTLTLVAAALGGTTGAAVREARDRVRRRAEEAMQVNRASAVVMRTYLVFLRRFFQDVTGSGTAPGRYNRAGSTNPPTYGPILKAQG